MIEGLFTKGSLEEVEAVLKGNRADAERLIIQKQGEIEALDTALALIHHARAARDAKKDPL